jgi:hypothetical protein
MKQEEIDRLEKERKIIYLLNIIIGILVAVMFFIFLKNIISLFEKPFNTTGQTFPPAFKILLITSITATILTFVSQHLKKSLNKKISEAIYSPAFKEKMQGLITKAV